MASSSNSKESKSSSRKRKHPTINPFLPNEESGNLAKKTKTTASAQSSSTLNNPPGSSSETHVKPNLDDADHDQQFLSGIVAYILPAGLGKARTDIFKKQMSKFGAEVLNVWDETHCTHLVVDEGMDVERLKRIMKIEKAPSNTYVLRASWLSLCLSENELVPIDNYKLRFPVIKKEDPSKKSDLSSTSTPSISSKSGIDGSDVNKSETLEKKPNISDIPSSSNAPPIQGTKWTSPVKIATSDRGYDSDDSNYVPSDGDDYQESVMVTTASDDAGSSSNVSTPATSPQKLPRGNWVCSKPSTSQQKNLNEHITEKLEVLMKTYNNTKDHWRAQGYRKAITALKQYPKEVTSWEEANKIPGIGTRLADKISEILESGHLRKIDHVCGGEDMKALDIFNNIWGVGPTVAQEWVQLGYRTLDDVREKAKLNRQQKIGLKHYEDFLQRMQREEAGEIERTVREMAESIDPGMLAVVCGSYRRGKTTCGDVDVLITHPDGRSHRGALGKILDGLRAKGFITDDLVRQGDDEEEQKKYMGVCKLPGENHKYRRLDIIVAPYSQYYCALMHFTGSGHFNRSIRLLAKKKGMSLSEHALRTGVIRHGQVKVHEGTPLPVTCEEDIFRHLGLEYREPEERDY
ncbi:DNA polymerase lambda-like [Patiria miniata]|uniref:DNA polymerase lambda n=1 Tax=Patiria miniata TaxID=46514 RepID=A0A913Z3P4_PATMI|nr:DNA polymerase lambda-like [Patiria miniata]